MGQRLDQKKHKGMVKVPNGHMFRFIKENGWICVSMTKEELE